MREPLSRAKRDFSAAIKSDEVESWAKTFGEAINIIDLAVRSLVNDLENLAKKLPSLPSPPSWLLDATKSVVSGLASLVPGGTTAFGAGLMLSGIHADLVAQGEESKKDQQRDVTEFTREQALALQEVRNAQELIKQNPFLSVDQKDTLLIPLIADEIQKLNGDIATGKGLLAGGTLDPANYDRVAQEVS